MKKQKIILRLRIIVLFTLLILLGFVVRWGGTETAADVRSSTAETRESEIFTRFDEWAGRFLSGNFAEDREFIKKGEDLAAQRRGLFRELIVRDPQSAIERAISAETQKRLPAEISQLLEKPVSARGDFNVLAIDGTDFSANGTSADALEREVVIDGNRFKAFVYGRKAAITTKLGIPLRGVILDDLIAVAENPVRKIEPAELLSRGVDPSKLTANGIVAEAAGRLEYFAGRMEFETYVRGLESWESKIGPEPSNELSPWTEGRKKLLLIRVDFPDREGVPVDRFGQVLTETFAQNLFDNPVNEFYVKNSYGKTSLATTVTPVVRMPQPQEDYPRDNLFRLVTDARNAARAAGYETNLYELDMVAFAQSPLLNFSGISPIGNKGALINGNFTFKVVTHELGHAYGLQHANLWRTDDGTITGSGTNVEYGDDFDMMGRGNTQATHFNANYKRSLDWLTEQNVQTVTRPGVYRLFAFDTETAPPQGIRALKIKKDSTRDYWIEFRQLLTNLPNLSDGALVRWDYPFDVTRQTQVLDMKPLTQSLDDSALPIGETFTDPASGLKITVLGKGNTTPESLDIRVEFNFSNLNGAAYDFDGDNRSDIGVFRPSEAIWYLNQTAQGFGALRFGLAADRIVPAKFDGDRKTDIAVYRDGTWYFYRSTVGDIVAQQFGLAGDIPVPADYDGDGFAELAVYRPSDGTWYLWNWVFQRFSAVRFGLAEDKPVPADYDGDGKTDIAVFRPSSGVWYLLRSEQGVGAAQFGLAADKPAPADYDGDGKADLGVYRPADGTWYLLQSANGFGAARWGVSTDIPATADYDGDGKSDLAVFRPSDGVWYRLLSSNGIFSPAHFGIGEDIPVSIGPNR
jgi:hypothetical protein